MARPKPSDGSKKENKTPNGTSRFEALFGFKSEELRTRDSLIRLLCRPTDPAGLGLLRLLFGCIMMVDIWQERGMSNLVEEYGYTDQCRFPLFSFLKPLPLVWMYIVYFTLFIGELGIMLGLFYRLSCVLYIICYWYIFFLNKRTWNNHSYLYGLTGIILLMVDGNRYWSVDGLMSSRKRHAHVPLWNYALLRFQIFIVYFIAGLKKLDLDWVSGYSMNSIAGHFVFAPFRLFLTEEQVSLFIIHLGGLIIDLSMGYLLFFDKTRLIAFTLGGSFHLMNSQLFSIGMFPWTMLATMPLFCYPNWPRYWMERLPSCCSCILPINLTIKPSDHCVYRKEQVKPDYQKLTIWPGYWIERLPSCCSCILPINLTIKPSDHGVYRKEHLKPDYQKCSESSLDQGRSPPPTQPKKYHRVMCTLLSCYVAIQCFLPYSHGITKGYNHWTQGLYGYSWDMMVHSWNIQHIKVSYIEKNTGEDGYLNPKAWSDSWRWSSHPDMVKQYADCVVERLASYNITNIELYIDVWKSVNDRFQQRSFDPRVNMLEAPWSPFVQTPWLLPLLIDLSDWRIKLAEIQKSIIDSDGYTDVVFVADFPGLYLENFVQEDLGNTSVTVLEGEVIIELVDQQRNYTLATGEKLQLPVGEFHNVHTVSGTPSCYMYIFVNTTDMVFKETINKYDAILNGTFQGSVMLGSVDDQHLDLLMSNDFEAVRIKNEVESGPQSALFRDHFRHREQKQEEKEMSLYKQFLQFIMGKFHALKRCVMLTCGAIQSVITGSSFEEFVNKTLMEERGTSHLPYTGNS